MNVFGDKVFAAPGAREWRGRFPYNEIISLLDVNRPFNLAESTSQDLTVGDVLDLAGLETLRGVKLGYGRSAGSAELREEQGFRASERSDDRNAKTLEMQFVTCSCSKSPAFCEMRTSAVFLDRPIRDTSGTSFAPSGVDVIAHASSRKIAFGAVLSTVFISRRANCETR